MAGRNLVQTLPPIRRPASFPVTKSWKWARFEAKRPESGTHAGIPKEDAAEIVLQVRFRSQVYLQLKKKRPA